MKDSIRFALCGCGHIAPRWLDAIAKNNKAKLVAVADPDSENLKKLDQYSFPDVKRFSTIEQAWNSTDIDAVIIATPPQYHTRYIIEAIEKGYHVLSEKPLCSNENQLKHIVHAQKLADEKHLITAINQQYRWNPRIKAIQTAVQSGKLGEIFLINSTFNHNNYHFKRWWRQQHLYINLINWYVHQVDTMRYLLDEKPVSVRAQFIHPPHSKIVGYSSMLMDVTFEKGTIWHITANQECVAGPTTSGHGHLFMYGTQGTLFNSKNDPPYLYTPDGEKHELGENIADQDNATTYPPGWPDTLEKFINAIETGQEHPTSIKDNLWTIGILFAAIRSFKEDKTIIIDDFIKKFM